MGNGSSTSTEHRIIEINSSNEPSSGSFPRNRITSSKYTPWNFVPKNLFEQFRRVGNFYFLMNAIATVVVKSPISPLTTALPLLFVILVTACKQGYEDILRYRSDRRVNNRPVSVIRYKCTQEIPCQQIVVGDLVWVNIDEEVPCDLLILHSSELSGKCYVTTSNLDGETNLKTLEVPRMFANLDRTQIVAMKAKITCETPQPSLYTFEGKVQASVPAQTIDDDEETLSCAGPLTIDNMALRGARLKDTDYIVGCAIYTGRDTKLSLNSKLSVNKFSTAEKSVNKYLLIFMALLLVEVCIFTGMKISVTKRAKWDAYLGTESSTVLKNVFTDAVSFLILFNYIVPISLYVTIELQKFLGSFFFAWDLKLYDELSDQPAIANTSDLNEDLGQIEYLFSDKTGTLTENLMIFRRCFVDSGLAYAEKDCSGKLHQLPPDGNEQNSKIADVWTPEIWHLLLGLCICHAVHIASPVIKARAELKRVEFRESFRLRKIKRVNSSLMMHPNLPEYQAASADEKALVEAAARLGVVFLGDRESDYIDIDAKGTILQYKRLDVLEFTSDRKRMSVIVRDTAGDVWLYCKGADSSVFPLLRRGKLEAAKAYVNDFSQRGFRTLVVGYRKLSEDEYAHLSAEMDMARQMIGEDRQRNVDSSYARLESGLTLLGVTAVEDRLQEGVPETLEKLRAAGIKVWILTGDKAETAENIAFFCGHFKKGTRVLRLMNHQDNQSCYIALTSFERKLKIDPFTQYGLIIDGTSMAIALKSCPSLLRNVAMASEAVVCCRMSPIQKSDMVQLVKRARSHPLTAAIGDGGNDVSMIKEAHVGLGITGKEGRQAAMSADFAFAKFQYLERVLLVHGHWYYLRIAMLVQYFFYKNLVFITPQLLFSVYNGFSSQALYDSVLLMLYNVIFSSAPILIFGISEKDYTDEKLLRYPQLYQLHRKNYLLSLGQFAVWIFMAIWQTCAIYYIPHCYWMLNPVNLHDSTPADHWCFSTCIFHLVTLVINLQLLLLSCHWTFLFGLNVFLTEAVFFLFAYVYCVFDFHYDGDMYRVFPKLLVSPNFWILTLLVVVVCMIPTFFVALHKSKRPNKLRGKLETREESISGIVYSPIERLSPILPNRRRSSTFVPWRGNFSCYDNKAF